jgi:hypothetical protein
MPGANREDRTAIASIPGMPTALGHLPELRKPGENWLKCLELQLAWNGAGSDALIRPAAGDYFTEAPSWSGKHRQRAFV